MQPGALRDARPGVPERLVALRAQQRHVLGDAVGDLLVEAVHRFVHRVLGHHPVRRVLAARHDHQARDRVRDGVLAGELAGGVRLAGQQRAQPRVDALHVVPGERRGEDRVDVFQEVVDVGAGRGGVRLVEVPVRVGGADDPVPPPGDDEQHALLGAQDEAGGGVDAVLGHHQVDALGGPYVELAALRDQALGVVRPHAGGVDHLAGADLEFAALFQVVHSGADDPLALAQEAHHACAVGHVRAVGGGGAHDRRDVARVVHLGVVVLEGAHQGVLLEAGRDAQRVLAGEVAVGGQAAAVAGGDGHGVVEGDARARVEPLPALVLKGVEKGHRAHQVGGDPLQQQPALLERLPYEREVEHLQIAQSAVDELAGAAGGARRPVAGLHETGRQSAGGRVQGGARADDAAADDQHVQFALRHPGERLAALGRAECRCPHHCLPCDRARAPPSDDSVRVGGARPGFTRLGNTGSMPPSNTEYESYFRLV